jgi:hypothetical protein
MYQSTQLQFRLMTVEAQEAAINRLLIQGCALEDIAARTGLSMQDLRSRLSSDRNATPVWSPPTPWRRGRMRSRQLDTGPG